MDICWPLKKPLGVMTPRAFSYAVMIGAPRWCHSGCAYLQPQHLQDQGTENTPDNTDKQLKQYFRYEQIADLPPLPN